MFFASFFFSWMIPAITAVNIFVLTVKVLNKTCIQDKKNLFMANLPINFIQTLYTYKGYMRLTPFQKKVFFFFKECGVKRYYEYIFSVRLHYAG